jgi:hypothetical protein
MTDEVIKAIKASLDAQGLSFAVIEDAVKAVMRVAADKNINGKHLIHKSSLSSANFRRSCSECRA